MTRDEITRIAISGALFLALIPSAHSRMDMVPGSRYTSARAAGMGDAFLPLGEDGASALFYNPANLGKKLPRTLELLNASAYGNSNYYDTLDRNFYKVTNLKNFSPTLLKNPKQFVSFGLSLAPSFYKKGFAIGLLANFQSGAQANIDHSIRYKSIYQFIPAVGVGGSYFGNTLRVGYSLQWVNQASGDLDTSVDASPMGYNQFLYEGSALSHTLGISYNPPTPFLPEFNLVLRNLFTAHFNSFTMMFIAQNSPGPPAREPMSADFSVNFTPRLGYSSLGNIVLQFRDITHQSRSPFYGRLAAGLEFVLTQRSPWLFYPGTGTSNNVRVTGQYYVRFGWASGYPAAGVGYHSEAFEYSLAWTSEDIGSYYHELQDARVMFQIHFRPF